MSGNPGSAGAVRRIVLTGFMGSGKTTVGRLLADRLHWEFEDLDHVIERQTGMAVPEIFAIHGEEAFRTAEHSALLELLQRSLLVLALGGGALEKNSFRDLLAASTNTVVVHLHAPFEVLYARCLTQAADASATARPLLGEEAAARERYHRRLTTYQQASHHIVNAAAGAPPLVVEEIVMRLKREVSTR